MSSKNAKIFLGQELSLSIIKIFGIKHEEMEALLVLYKLVTRLV